MKKYLLIVISVLAALKIFTEFAQKELHRHEEKSQLEEMWQSWKLNNMKVYENEEIDQQKFQVFCDNYEKINKYNQEHPEITLAINLFADLTNEEFAALYTSPSIKDNIKVDTLCNGELTGCPLYNTSDLPSSFDWRPKGAVTPVKNQADCGSCWAFSTTGSLEGLYFLNNSNLLSFSEQQLVDCDLTNYGCDGGWPDVAFQYTAQYGNELESTYPYTGQQDGCQYNPSFVTYVNTGCNCVQNKSQEQLMAAVNTQPVSILVEANQLPWQFYHDGVISTGCGSAIDHAVLAVGYEEVKGVNSWIVKNSWGSSWGNSGYLYISQDGSENNGYGVCGIYWGPMVPTNTSSSA